MRPLIAANWKMHKNILEAQEYFDAWWKEAVPESVEAAFFPPFPLLPLVKPLLDGDESLGAQSCHEEDGGAYTGEVSCGLLKDVGCRYVLVGHSERRQNFKESDGLLAAKFRAVLRNDLRPVLCVGELLEHREAGKTLELVERQLVGALGDEPPSHGFDVAYEPVWAIGTGKVATPADAEEVHNFIRKWLIDRKAGEDVRLLYGGSVKPANARELMAVPEISGVLVGGASLDPHSFASITRACA